MTFNRLLVASSLAAASVSLVACGGSSPAPLILNTETIERSIEHTSLIERHKHVNVSCPSGVHQQKGLVFACTAVAKGGTARFIVTETDGEGRVHYRAG